MGEAKLIRICQLAEQIDVSFGLDSIAQADMVEKVFDGEGKRAEILIEIEVGEDRSGVIQEKDFIELPEHLKTCRNIHLKGVFSHDGHSYSAKDLAECESVHMESQRRTLRFAQLAEALGFRLETVSIGSTPSMLHDFAILPGITEIRPGTYIFMDAAQANAYGSHERNASSILTSIISLPTPERVITDVGAKGLTLRRGPRVLQLQKAWGR